MITFLKKLWHTERKNQPSMQFGRFSDLYKPAQKYKDWDRALESYAKGQYFDSFRSFIDYIRDDEYDNVKTFSEANNKINFELIQGSKLIQGFATKEVVFAEAKIACGHIELGAMRMLLEENYDLKYTRYALDGDDNLTIVFQSEMIDASPYKLFNGFKELAIRADHQDDILLNKFEDLKAINVEYTSQISESEFNVKQDFFRKSLLTLRTNLSSNPLNAEEYPGSISYLILDIIYQFDYLMKPEGRLLELIQNIDKIYFSEVDQDPKLKNIAMLKIVDEMENISSDSLSKELYDTVHTFGIPQVGSVNNFQSFVQNEIRQMVWYVSNDHIAVAQSICNFVIGHTLFNYAMPEVIQRHLQFYFRVIAAPFYIQLGYETILNDRGKLDKKAILKEIDLLHESLSEKYLVIGYNAKDLDFSSNIQFSISWLSLLARISFSKKADIVTK